VRSVGIALVVAGCGFRAGTYSDLTGTDDASIDGLSTEADADGVDAPPVVCANPTLWTATFDVDPTTQNANGDGTNDWAMRDMGTVPGILANGIWAEPGSSIRPLDSQPKQDFATRTVVDVRMRNTVRASTFGAVMWINVDYTTTSFAPLYVVVQLQTGGTAQDVTVFHKTNPSTSVPLFQTTADTGFVDVRLDVDPAVDSVAITVNGSTTPHTYSTINRNANDDRWATVLAWNGDSEFDTMRVSVCP